MSHPSFPHGEFQVSSWLSGSLAIVWPKKETIPQIRESVSRRHVITWSDAVSRFTLAEWMFPFKSQTGFKGEYDKSNYLLAVSGWMSFSFGLKSVLFAAELTDWLTAATYSVSPAKAGFHMSRRSNVLFTLGKYIIGNVKSCFPSTKPVPCDLLRNMLTWTDQCCFFPPICQHL